ncbi:GNAT family N-acetyltransferase [Bacillus xiapuensis]|uniref:GNAT family N-acetyltransferase n=1 Tax=Bacillus xiapuensis TaxID=2014075 RepID=A0ABU6N9U3_9BACI|nr:GNAT family N-acetyltransferase [Bacillus xiapuensis]
MRVEKLNNENVRDFVEYCKKHRSELDDSFLYDENLMEFKPNKENPTYIVTNKLGKIIAAASLMIDDYNQRGRKARFRIFYSSKKSLECYRLLIKAMLPHTNNLDKIFLFIPLKNKQLLKSVEQLGFTIERYTFLMVREETDVPDVIFPKEYILKTFRTNQDEEIWCEVRNAAFANLKGNETPIRPEDVWEMVSSGNFLEGGMKILFHKEKPVGVVRGTIEEHNDEPIMNIGPLAILPEYQGKGLGRLILRASLHFAKENFYKKVILSVNGENEGAKSLYTKEGFKEVEAYACCQYEIRKVN